MKPRKISCSTGARPCRSVIEAGKRATVRHGDEPAVRGISPRMIGAGDAPAAVAFASSSRREARCRQTLWKDVLTPSSPRIGDERFAEKIERMEVTGARYVTRVTEQLPAAAEDPLRLELEEFRIAVDPGGRG